MIHCTTFLPVSIRLRRPESLLTTTQRFCFLTSSSSKSSPIHSKSLLLFHLTPKLLFPECFFVLCFLSDHFCINSFLQVCCIAVLQMSILCSCFANHLTSKASKVMWRFFFQNGITKRLKYIARHLVLLPMMLPVLSSAKCRTNTPTTKTCVTSTCYSKPSSSNTWNPMHSGTPLRQQ